MILRFSGYYIKDPFHFATTFNNFSLPEGYILVSLDVVSLITVIPLQLCIEVLPTNGI